MTAMVNESDIDLMNEWRSDMVRNREFPVTVIYVDILRDPITGAVIGEGEVPREVIAVVTELSIKSANGSRKVEGGIYYEEGDIKVDIAIELIDDIASEIERIKHDGKDYEIIGVDKKGIGRRNRYEFTGREIS